ncbi:MAG: hypothetical protein LBG11_01435 [Bifidobacteriaceae bacterium]|jgi:hypothetical protein|nr:hypothetical protein [Bifidobacteriaceae bacterium]
MPELEAVVAITAAAMSAQSLFDQIWERLVPALQAGAAGASFSAADDAALARKLEQAAIAPPGAGWAAVAQAKALAALGLTATARLALKADRTPPAAGHRAAWPTPSLAYRPASSTAARPARIGRRRLPTPLCYSHVFARGNDGLASIRSFPVCRTIGMRRRRAFAVVRGFCRVRWGVFRGFWQRTGRRGSFWGRGVLLPAPPKFRGKRLIYSPT